MSDELQEILDLVDDMYKDTAAGLDDAMEGWDYGTTEGSKEDDEAFARFMLAQPENFPGTITYKDGRVEENMSPYVAVLKEGMVESPKGAWRGFKAALERVGTLPWPVAQPVAVGAPPDVVPPAPLAPPPPQSMPVDKNGVALSLGGPPSQPIGGM